MLLINAIDNPNKHGLYHITPIEQFNKVEDIVNFSENQPNYIHQIYTHCQIGYFLICTIDLPTLCRKKQKWWRIHAGSGQHTYRSILGSNSIDKNIHGETIYGTVGLQQPRNHYPLRIQTRIEFIRFKDKLCVSPQAGCMHSHEMLL